MKNKKVILSSILSLVLCLGLIAGGTFALFTSKVETNIAVTAAKIELTAAIDDTTVQTKHWGTDYVDGKDGISPDATVEIDGADITLNNIIPGDGVKFDIEISNASTIAIQYRIVIENKNGSGLNGLVATIGNISYSGVKAGTEWVKIEKGVQIENIPVTIEFPDADDNDNYQGATTELVVRVEAVQGVSEPKNTVYPSTPAELNNVISSASKDEPIEVDLPAGSYTLPAMSDKDVTFTGTKDTTIDISNAINASNSNVALNGVTVDCGNSTYTGIQHSNEVVFEDCVLNGTQFLYAKDVTFVDCEFVVSGDAYAVWTYGAENVTFTNCTFNTDGKAILVYTEGAHTATITVNGCTFNDSDALKETDGSNLKKAAIEIGESAYGNKANYTIIIDDCVVNGFNENNSTSALWGNKNNMDTDHLNVVIDGDDVY